MSNTMLKTLLEEGRKKRYEKYYVVECPYCHEKIAVQYKNVEIKLFEPKEVEQEREVLHFEEKQDGKVGKLLKRETETYKDLISSDNTKDEVIIEMCPQCGHRNITMLRNDFLKLPVVGWDGTNNFEFELDEVETQAVKDFVKEHKNCCIEKLGKKLFSSSGGQFSFHITPTGLGNLVSVHCNACKKHKEVTNIENW